MRYAFSFFILGLVFLYTASVSKGIFKWILLWSALSFILIGLAYVWIGPGIFGKRPTGELGRLRVLLLLPYLAFSWGIWHVQRYVAKEDCYNEIAPGLWLGRRAYVEEIPENATMIVDLAAEFPAPRDVGKKGFYVSCPMLDGSTIEEEQFLKLVEKIAHWDGGVFIHCAQGHGRSATVAAATLIAKGFARDMGEAELLIKKNRPRIYIHKKQRELVESVFKELHS